jgi:cytochrome P450
MSPISSSSSMAHLRRQLPPSPPHPVILQTLGGRRWPFAYLERCQASCGNQFTLYPIDMPPIVFLTDPQDIRAVLTADPRDLHPGAGASVIAPLIGKQSFMLLEEDDHAYGRKTITPAFHQRMVAEQTATLTSIVEKDIAAWPLDRAVALHPRIRSLTLTVILRIIFSDQDTSLVPLHQRLMNMLTITDSFILQEPKLRHIPGWHGTWRGFVKQRAEVDELIYGLLSQRRSARERQPLDLLDMLLAAENPDGSPMSDQQVRDNLMSMILAGHETTTGELAWAFQLLAHNQRVQSNLAQEVHDGCHEEYLTATVNETMRHKPVFVFTIPRKVARPIEIGGWTYPPGVHLAACTYLMHHRADLYPDPHKFRPERFLGAAAQSRTWLPWGGGSKHCLGRHFALAEVKTILQHVLATRAVFPASKRIEHPRWRSAILVPHAGGRVILRKRIR